MTAFVFRPVPGRYYKQSQENGARLPSYQFRARVGERAELVWMRPTPALHARAQHSLDKCISAQT